MKILWLLRHAKSDWSATGCPDFYRPLASRGLKDLARHGQKLRAALEDVERVYVSPSSRTLFTWLGLGLHHLPASQVFFPPALYEAPAEEISTYVRHLPNHLEQVLFIGHNPGFLDFVNDVKREPSYKPLDRLPTLGLVQLIFPGDTWGQVTGREATLKLLWYPKHYEDPTNALAIYHDGFDDPDRWG
jgi:phosphohistidine phosphatase